jgi:hypothetical protein
MVMLKDQKIFLMMRINDGSDNGVIHYTTDEPLKLKEEFVDHYKSCNVLDQLRFYEYSWRAWCIQFGFGALQKALGRHELARMSRVDRVRLFVCLVSILKKISQAKLPHELMIGTPNLMPPSVLYRQWENMRTHLISAITYHLRQIEPHCFLSNSAIGKCFVKSSDGLFASYSIFSTLEGEIGELLKDKLSGTQKSSLLKASEPALKLVFPVKEPNYGAGPCHNPSETSRLHKTSDKKFSHHLEDLSLALAGCTLSDVDVDGNVLITETTGSHEGMFSHFWTWNISDRTSDSQVWTTT